MSYDLKIFDESGAVIVAVPISKLSKAEQRNLFGQYWPEIPAPEQQPPSGAAAEDKEIRPNLLNILDREAPPIDAERRQRLISEIAAACDGASVVVKDVRTTFHVPVATFLDHVRSDALVALRWTLRGFATRLAGHAGRMEPAFFVERLRALDDQLVEELEKRFLDVGVEAGELGFDLLASDASEQPAQGGAVAGRGELLDQAGGKTRQRSGRGGELGGSVSGVAQGSRPSKDIKKRRGGVSKHKRARR